MWVGWGNVWRVSGMERDWTYGRWCVVRVHRVGALMCPHFRMSKDRLGHECIDYMR